jgi:hypothetical protein
MITDATRFNLSGIDQFFQRQHNRLLALDCGRLKIDG